MSVNLKSCCCFTGTVKGWDGGWTSNPAANTRTSFLHSKGVSFTTCTVKVKWVNATKKQQAGLVFQDFERLGIISHGLYETNATPSGSRQSPVVPGHRSKSRTRFSLTEYGLHFIIAVTPVSAWKAWASEAPPKIGYRRAWMFHRGSSQTPHLHSGSLLHTSKGILMEVPRNIAPWV